ncbi:MAG: chorismate-binding protein [Bacteroidales bacterium]
MSSRAKIQIQNQIFENLPAWVFFRLPNKASSVFMGGNLEIIGSEQWVEKNGFVFFPFKPSENCPVLFLQKTTHVENVENHDFCFPDQNSVLNFQSSNEMFYQISREEYLQNLEELILLHKAGIADKVVLSRTIVTESIPSMRLPALYRELCLKYPSAFVYLAHFPPFGTWIGATPETLISCAGNNCTTMSLAGTRPVGSKGTWGDKEIEEQAIVTRFINEKIQSLSPGNIEISTPFTLAAGQVEHLCTTFRFDISNPSKLGLLAESLHPTPAVCGMPREKALQLIEQFEKHDREYYTGFLGSVGFEKRTELFVNLRCMKILREQMVLYVGGGITSDSVPEKEWQETELKALTLMAIIEKIQKLAP